MIARRFLVAILACALLLLPMVGAGESKAVAQEELAGISASMNSFYYKPGDLAYIDIDLELSGAARTDDIYVELLIYPSAATRSQLASFREGTRRYSIARRTLETITPESEWTDKMYEIDLKALGLQTGVYPFEVRLLQGGEVLSADQNFLVIVDPTAGYPLNLSLLWTLDFLPSTDAQGSELDAGLAAACSPDPSESGFVYTLSRVIKKTPEVRSSLVVPAATYSDLQALAAEAGEEVSGDAAEGASEILTTLDNALLGGQIDFLGTTYAFADPETLVTQDWEEQMTEDGTAESDAARQLRLGLAFAAETGSGGSGFVAPLFHLGDVILQSVVESGVEFTVVGKEALEASAAGRRLLEGTTISQPVRFVNSGGYTLKAFVRDETLYAYLENIPQVDASHMVQNVLAELAVLQREKPYVVRSCVLAFPPGFMPTQEFLDELYGAIKGCLWLQTRRLSELNADQFPLEDVALQAPTYPNTASSYLQRLGTVRSNIEDFTATIPAGHSLRDELQHSLLIAENYRFTSDKDAAAAQAYLGSIEAVIQGETSKVNIEQKRSVTLSSTEGKLSVDITSTLNYPLENVTLRMENASLTFPEGKARQVTIEPRENRFIFEVDTHRKGSFIVDIVLESGGLVVDSTSTTVNTSIINTLAIILLACLAVIFALVILTRRLLQRYRGGKHTRGRTDK